MFGKKNRKNDDPKGNNGAGKKRADFGIEPLEKRVLMSASWVDADTGESQDGPTASGDHFTGTAGADIADGGKGDDLLEGLGGDDTLSGDKGSDFLDGGAGDDVLDGGKGDDTVSYTIGDGVDAVDGGKGEDVLVINGVEGVEADVLVEDGATYSARTGEPADADKVIVSVNGEKSIEATNIEQIEFNAANAGDTINLSGDFSGTDLDADGITVNEAPEPANSAPTDINITGGTVSENAAGGTYVATASAVDSDSGDSHTYELADDAGGRFVINAATGEITVADGADLNFEADTNHEITVRVTDSEGESFEEAIDIEVANVQETFVLSGNDTLSAADGPFENVVINGGYLEIDGDVEINGDLTITSAARINGGELRVTGDVTTSDSSYHGSATIVLDGDGAQTISANGGTGELHRVSIENTSGEVTIVDDIEISGSYDDNGNTVDATGANVEIQGNAAVSGSGTTFGDVTVNGGYVEMTDVDIDGDLTIEKVARINGSEISVSGDVTTSDSSYHGSVTIVLDGDGAQTISANGGTGELHRVSIENTSGEVTIVDDIEISGSYDDNGNEVDASGAKFTIQGNASITAGSTAFNDVAIEAGYIELHGDMYVQGDADVTNLARINGGTIYVAGEINDTDANWHGSGDIQPWIQNEAPTDIEFTGGSVAENAAAGTVVASAAVTDADDGDTHTFELTEDAEGRFEIDADGNITVAPGADLDFESADSHEVTVRVTDSAGETYDETFEIAVSDVNEAPTELVLDAENPTQNLLTVTLGGQRAGGADNMGAAHYEIVVDGEVVASGDADWMDSTRFNDQDPESRWRNISIELPGDVSPDEVEVRFTNDSWGGTSDTDRNLYVDKIEMNGQSYEAESSDTQYDRGSSTIGGQEAMAWNGALRFDTSNAPDPLHAVVSENAEGATVGQLATADPDSGDTFSYEVDDNRFEVTDDGTLKLRDGISLNHETEPVVGIAVTSTDSAGNEIVSEFAVGVADVNEGPSDLSFTGGTIAENAAAGTQVASASVTDVDDGDSHSFELTDDASGRFAIDADGNITVAQGASLDHESAGEHEVTVRVTDAAGETYEEALTITVGDVNEGPSDLTFTGGTVAENAAAGTQVASASVTDVDDGDTHSFELTEDASGRFEIDADGNITVAEGADLDHESAGSHEVTVRVTDAAGETYEEALTITVGDVNEAPTELSYTGGSVAENARAGTIVANAAVSDADIGDTHSFELLGDADGRFEIDSDGVVRVAQGATLDHESADSHEITIRVTDSEGEFLEETIEITVSDVDEAPELDAQDITVNDGEMVTLSINARTSDGVDFDSVDIDSYGGASQDRDLVVETDGDTLSMSGNGWKSIDYDYTVTEDTILEFQFKSGSEGEIHGIGFDTDGSIDAGKTFQLHGTQDWGIDMSSDYEGNDGEWVTYQIRVGDHFQGDFDRMFFVNDHDAGGQDGDSAFRGVRVYEEGSAQISADDLEYTWEQVSGPEVVLDDPNAVTPTFESPPVDADTDVVFRVTVANGDDVSTEEVTVHVVSVNDVPEIDAGEDMFVNENTPVTLGVEVAEGPASVDFDAVDVDSYGGSSQDRDLIVETDGDMLSMSGNGWKSIDYDYTVTEDTILEFQFKSGSEGEIHGIGFDTDGSIDAGKTFQLHGTQDWGIDMSSDYEGNDGEWVTYQIRVGDHFQGDFDRMFFVNDHDAGSQDGDSAFRGIKVYEDGQGQAANNDLEYTWEQVSGPAVVLDDANATSPTFDSPAVDSDTELVFKVTVRDGEDFRTDEVTVHVAPVNDAPTDLSFTGGSVAENAAAGTQVASVSVTDVDANDTHTYELVGDADGRFEIDSDGNITVAEGADLDHEAAGSHDVTVRVTDSGGETIEESLTITVGDVNETPIEMSFAGGSVAENAPAGTQVASVSVTDVDANDTHTYELVGDADGRFEIDSDGNITVAEGADLDHEAAGSHEVTVRVTDSGGETIEESLTITVGDVNETPIEMSFAGGSVAENAAAGTQVASVSVTDVDANDTGTYELVGDADGRFEIDSDGNITVAEGADLDHEAAGSHDVTVRVTDSGGETIEESLTITVGDVNETPIEMSFTGGSVAENAPAGTQVASVSVTDVDDGDSHSFELTDDASGRFEIDADGNITVAEGADLDHEAAGSHELTVRVTDSGGETIEESLTITVGDVNETPIEMSFTGGSVAENAPAGTQVASVSVTDVDDGDTHSFELTDDASGRFEIDADGNITVAQGASLDHESAGEHEVTVRVTDAAGETYEEALTITVGDVNEGPSDLAFTGGTVAENAAAGTQVASASVTDVDDGDTHSFELTDDADGRFEIDSDGNIAVAEGADLDHEAASSHEVTVRVTDSGGETIEESLTITVGDVNEGPEQLTFTGGQVVENALPGTLVAKASVVDPDAADTHAFELVGDGNGAFAIDGEGNITVLDAAALDHEQQAAHELTVRVTDAAGESVEKTLTITVGDVNEAPTLIELTGGTVPEGVPGAMIGSLGLVDPDADDDAGFAVSDSRFEVTQTGQLKLRDGVSLDHETTPTIEVEIIGTDSAGNSIDDVFTISVGDVNEAPETMSFTGGEVSEDALPGTVVASVAVTDQDAGETFSYELVDDAGGRFSIDESGNVVVTGEPQLDFEFDTAHNVVVRVTDSAGQSIEQTLDISVTNVTELEPESEVEETGAAPDEAEPAERPQRIGRISTAERAEPDGLAEQTIPEHEHVNYEAEADQLDTIGNDAQQTLEWVADEIDEITQIARSVESADLGLLDSTGSGEETGFDDTFIPLDGVLGVDPDEGVADGEPVSESNADGFLSKFWVMLRAGLGTTNRADDGQTAAGANERTAGGQRSRRK